jgi:hypothetical protein
VHVVSHAVDSDLRGRDTDLPSLSVVALLIVIAAAARTPMEPRETAPNADSPPTGDPLEDAR